MKSLSFIAIVLLLASVAMAQTKRPCSTCLPEGIELTLQSQVDSFQANYPNCTEIMGGVHISGDDITNLNGLNTVTSIGGALDVYGGDALTNLAGLENVSFIGGDITIIWCDNLSSLAGLDGLNSIGQSIFIYSNPSLASLEGLEQVTSVGGHLSFYHNMSLSSLEALANLTTVGGGFSLTWHDALGSLAGLDQLSNVGGDVHINYNPALEDMSGLDNLATIGGSLKIDHNTEMSRLNGLEQLTSVGDTVRIDNNSILNLSGLDNIEAGSISYLKIMDNPGLSICDIQFVCEYLALPVSPAQIYGNAPGCDSREEVTDACLLGWEESSVFSLQSSVYIYPNPAYDVIFIETPGSLSKFQFSIFNISGQQVMQRQMSAPHSEIDLAPLKAGVYFVKIISDDRVLVEKVVKR